MNDQKNGKEGNSGSQDEDRPFDEAEKSLGRVEETLNEVNRRIRALEELLARLERQAENPSGTFDDELNFTPWNTETGLA